MFKKMITIHARKRKSKYACIERLLDNKIVEKIHARSTKRKYACIKKNFIMWQGGGVFCRK